MPDQYLLPLSGGASLEAFWEHSPDEVPLASDFESWIDQCCHHIGPDSKILAGLRIRCYSPERADRFILARNNGLLFTQGDDGLTWFDGLIELRGGVSNPARTFGHEFVGHRHVMSHGIYNGSDWAGQTGWVLYTQWYGPYFTRATPGGERIAEDGVDLFGPNGVQGTVDPNDDGGPLPWNKAGLPAFLLCVGPVVEYWRKQQAGTVISATFNPTDRGGTFWWWRGRFERCCPGLWEFWNGSGWVEFVP